MKLTAYASQKCAYNAKFLSINCIRGENEEEFFIHNTFLSLSGPPDTTSMKWIYSDLLNAVFYLYKL